MIASTPLFSNDIEFNGAFGELDACVTCADFSVSAWIKSDAQSWSGTSTVLSLSSADHSAPDDTIFTMQNGGNAPGCFVGIHGSEGDQGASVVSPDYAPFEWTLVSCTFTVDTSTIQAYLNDGQGPLTSQQTVNPLMRGSRRTWLTIGAEYSRWSSPVQAFVNQYRGYIGEVLIYKDYIFTASDVSDYYHSLTLLPHYSNIFAHYRFTPNDRDVDSTLRDYSSVNSTTNKGVKIYAKGNGQGQKYLNPTAFAPPSASFSNCRNNYTCDEGYTTCPMNWWNHNDAICNIDLPTLQQDPLNCGQCDMRCMYSYSGYIPACNQSVCVNNTLCNYQYLSINSNALGSVSLPHSSVNGLFSTLSFDLSAITNLFISFWVRPYSLSTAKQVVLSVGRFDVSFGVGYMNEYLYVEYVNQHGGGGEYPVGLAQSPVPSTVGEWDFVVVTFNEHTPNAVLSLYLNGEYAGAFTATDFLLYPYSSYLVIGAQLSASQPFLFDYPFNGDVDELRIKDQSYSIDDINAYINGTALFDQGTDYLYYSFHYPYHAPVTRPSATDYLMNAGEFDRSVFGGTGRPMGNVSIGDWHPPFSCSASSCPTFPSPTILCAGSCISEEQLLIDPNNCGACGHQCHGEQRCVNGSCMCPSLNETNIDLMSNADHCGSCFHACPSSHLYARYCGEGVCGFNCSEGITTCDDRVTDGFIELINLAGGSVGGGSVDAPHTANILGRLPVNPSAMNLSISLWLQLPPGLISNNGTYTPYLFTLGQPNHNESTDTSFQMELFLDGQGNLKFFLTNCVGQTASIVDLEQYALQLQTEWTLITVTLSDEGQRIMYINSEYVADTGDMTDGLAPLNHSIYSESNIYSIGALPDYSFDYSSPSYMEGTLFNGFIDEVYIMEGVVSAYEISQYYQGNYEYGQLWNSTVTPLIYLRFDATDAANYAQLNAQVADHADYDNVTTTVALLEGATVNSTYVYHVGTVRPPSFHPVVVACNYMQSNYQSDDLNCNGCNHVCTLGTHCGNGTCACANGDQPGLNGTNDNCAFCGDACDTGAGETCHQGLCLCSDGNKLNNDTYVNCGTCGKHGTRMTVTIIFTCSHPTPHGL
jgi:hypothetical protein